MAIFDLDEFRRQVLAFMDEQQLAMPGSRVIVAVSGGADSMALLAFLLAAAPARGLTVEAAHLEHGLRGEASRQDAAFVRAYCREHGVPLHEAALRQLAGESYPPCPGEAWLRRQRYAWFGRLARERGACIATAHTLNDQAETLLLHLARGTGVHGAGGIRAKRGPYIRPFLQQPRTAIEAYCAARGLAYVTDASNLGDDYARNRLRHHAVPALEGVSAGALQAMGRFCARMQRLDGYLTAGAETLLQEAACPGGWQLDTLRRADWPQREMALWLLAGQVCDPSEQRLARLMQLVEEGTGVVQLARGRRLRAANGILGWYTPPKAPPQSPAPPVPLAPGRYHFAGGYTVAVERMDYENFIKFAAVHKKDLNYCADYDKIQDNVAFRVRAPGDVFRPRGRGLTKPLRKYYQELGVPSSQRGLLPLAASGSQVVWLWGQGFADGLAPGPGTRDVLKIIPVEGQEETK